MPSFSKSEVVLVRYPFSDLTAAKVRPAVVVSEAHSSKDCMIVPVTILTSVDILFTTAYLSTANGPRNFGPLK